MSIQVNALQDRLCASLCEEVRVTERSDGALMLRTRFEFPDGDRYPIRVLECGDGGVRLSDCGHTLMHISYEHDIDAFVTGPRGQLIEQISVECGVEWSGGAFHIDTPVDDLPSAIFRFGQALTRVYDLTFLSRSSSKSTFYDDLADMLRGMIDSEKIAPEYVPEDVPNADAYRVDYCIEGRNDRPLFLYGLPNRDKVRLTTIMLSHFHRHALEFASLLVFQDQSAIPRLDLARLSDVGGEMISSLDAEADFRRKLLDRIAA